MTDSGKRGLRGGLPEYALILALIAIVILVWAIYVGRS